MNMIYLFRKCQFAHLIIPFEHINQQIYPIQRENSIHHKLNTQSLCDL